MKEILISKGFTIAEKIPTTDTTIVLFNAPERSRLLQTGYNLLNTVGFWLPLIAMALASIGIFVAHASRKALAWFGFGLMLAMAVAAGLLAVGRTVYLAELPDTVNTAAATAFFDQFTLFLRQSLWAGAAAGRCFCSVDCCSAGARPPRGIRSVPVRRGGSHPGLAGFDGATDVRAASNRGLAGDRPSHRGGTGRAGLHHVAALQDPRAHPWTTVGLLVTLFVIQIFASGEDVSAGTGGRSHLDRLRCAQHKRPRRRLGLTTVHQRRKTSRRSARR